MPSFFKKFLSNKEILAKQTPNDYEGVEFGKNIKMIKDGDNDPVVEVEIYKHNLNNPENKPGAGLSTGKLGKYAISKPVADFIAKPKCVQPGMLGISYYPDDDPDDDLEELKR